MNKSTLPALILPLVLASTSVSAQQLEEVVVTATKRAAGLQDVPIAISVMSGEKISDLGLTNLEDVTAYLPNIHVAEGGAGTQLFIRGINYGFEQSVGTFIDGVYYGRGRSARGKFLDLERVEVLKGPQSTLFGKNTVAGAINITTAKPGTEFEAFVDLNYGTELEGLGITAMVTGPLGENVRGRLVAKKYEDDGYVTNDAAGGVDGPQQDNFYVRGSLAWDVTDNLSLDFKAESGQFDVLGRQQVLSEASATAVQIYQAFGDPNFQPGFNYQTFDVGINEVDPFDDTESSVYQLTAEYAAGEHTIRSITAFTEYEFTNRADSDYSPLEFIARGRTEEHEQFSQEILWQSPTGGAIEYMAGAYYQTEKLTNNRNTQLFFSNVGVVEAPILGLLEPVLGFLPPSGFIDGIGNSFFTQDTDSWSVFTELTFNLSDTFRVTAGVRYSDDQKDMTKRGFVGDTNNVESPLLGSIYGPSGLNLAAPHDFARSRSEQHTTGHLNLQWDATNSSLLYFNVANGFKAGGFDEDNGLGRLDVAEYEDEAVDSFEAGAKITLAEGRGRLNIAAFSSEYEDVQVSTFDGNAAFVVGNAARTEVIGIELDILYALTDNVTINGAFAYLDATYKSFTQAACTNDQEVDGSCAANGGVQDLSGQPLQFAPEYTANIGIEYITSISNGMELGINADYNWSDDTVIANDLDANLIQASHGKLNARIGLASTDGSWILAIIGKNLTDETTFKWGNDVPLGAFGFRSTYFKNIDPPRTIEFNARYNF